MSMIDRQDVSAVAPGVVVKPLPVGATAGRKIGGGWPYVCFLGMIVGMRPMGQPQGGEKTSHRRRGRCTRDAQPPP